MAIRVLCIEDDAETRVLIKRALENQGMEVDTVWEGEKGLAAARSGRFDCVLLDIMMPGLDGFGVLGELRKEPSARRLPVVVVTARSDAESRERAFSLGADEYVVKPFSFERLRMIIQRLVAPHPGSPDTKPS
jgi:two-component system copper resistance phosphate regulon response regulator CusR